MCSACTRLKIGCTRRDIPQKPKQKSSLFIELDVEGDWVHHIKQPHIDKGKGQMVMIGSDAEDSWDDPMAQC